MKSKIQNFFLTSQSICDERERELLYRKEELFKYSSFKTSYEGRSKLVGDLIE